MFDLILVNVFSILIVGILLISMKIGKATLDYSAKKFMNLIHMVLLYIVLNLSTELVEGVISLRIISYIINFLTYLSIDLIFVAFCFYFGSLVKENKNKIKRIINVELGLSCLSVVFISILFAIKKLFYINDNGEYVELEGAFFPYFITSIELVLMVFAAIKAKSNFSKSQFIVILLYLLLPIPAIVIESYTNNYSLSIVAIVLTILLIYIFIQNEAIEEARMKGEILDEVSRTDLLTGLNNRRAYYLRTSNFNNKTMVGVIFSDLNGLKYTNDHYGHEKGDELIKNYADLLVNNFKKEDIFRISGDEFIVLNTSLEEHEFLKQALKFVKLLEANNYIASAGFAYGSSQCFDKLVSEAEGLMYEHKEIAHQKIKR